MIAKIKGTGSCVPENVVDNNELSKMMETNDEWRNHSKHVNRGWKESLRKCQCKTRGN